MAFAESHHPAALPPNVEHALGAAAPRTRRLFDSFLKVLDAERVVMLALNWLGSIRVGERSVYLFPFRRAVAEDAVTLLLCPVEEVEDVEAAGGEGLDDVIAGALRLVVTATSVGAEGVDVPLELLSAEVLRDILTASLGGSAETPGDEGAWELLEVGANSPTPSSEGDREGEREGEGREEREGEGEREEREGC